MSVAAFEKRYVTNVFLQRENSCCFYGVLTEDGKEKAFKECGSFFPATMIDEFRNFICGHTSERLSSRTHLAVDKQNGTNVESTTASGTFKLPNS